MGRTENVVTIDDSYSVTVPASVREAAGIDVGDTVRWVVDDAGAVGVEVVGEHEAGLADLEPVDVGGEAHAAADHDLVAGDRWMPVVVDANVLVAARLERDEDHERGVRLANAFDRGDLPTTYVPSDVLRASQRIFTADPGMRLRDHRHVPARGRHETSDPEGSVMSSTGRDIRLTRREGSEYWVARDERTGVASQGKTREEALQNLDEAIALHESDEDSIDTPAEERAVLEELGIDPDEVEAAREDDDELPEFMQ